MNVRIATRLLAPLAAAVLAAGCGGSSDPQPPPPPVTRPPATVAVTTSAASALVGTGSITVTANVRAEDGAPVNEGTAVVFAASAGSVSSTGRTDAAGNASATLTSATGGPVTVFVTAGSLPAQTRVVTFVDPNAPRAVSLAAAASLAVVDQAVVVTATVLPEGDDGAGRNGVIPNGTTVDFTTTGGTLSSVTTTTGGRATAVLGGVGAPGTVFVTAFVGGLASLPLMVTFEDPLLPGAVSVTALPAAGFIGAAGVTVRARVVAEAGGAPRAGTPVAFSLRSGSGALSAASGTTDAAGDAAVTLTSPVEGIVVVAATADSAIGPVTGTAAVTFTDPSRPVAVSLAADPGSGVTQDQRPVTLRASIVPADPANGAIPDGTVVTFSVTSGAGALSSATAPTAGGVATVTLNASAAGAVTVTARAGAGAGVTSAPLSVPFVAQPTVAIVRIGTVGTLPAGASIGGVSAVVRASPAAGLSLAEPDVTASGAGAGALLAANVANPSADVIALVSATGFPAGEFATVTFRVAQGTFPSPGDFSAALTGPGVIDTAGATLPLGVGVVSVTIQ